LIDLLFEVVAIQAELLALALFVQRQIRSAMPLYSGICGTLRHGMPPLRMPQGSSTFRKGSRPAPSRIGISVYGHSSANYRRDEFLLATD